MASCTLCASLLLDANRSETRFTTRDKALSHAAQHLSQTKHFDDETCSSLDQVFDQCFPNYVDIPTRIQQKIAVKKEGRLSLLNICHTIFKGRISNATPRVTCQKCGTEIILCGKKNSKIRFEIAIDHASGHLGLDLFECRKCERSFSSKNTVRNHLRVTHRLKCLSEYFADKSGDFIDEITNSIEQCFTEGNNNNGLSVEKGRIISLKNESSVRSRTKGSKLAIERQLFCYRLIRQLAGDDGKVQCRLCPKRIYIKHKKGFKVQCALAHTLLHLKKPLFRCNVCLNVRHTRRSLRSHLKSAHALPLMNNYDCLVDEFHADVLEMFRKCYSEELGK